MTTSCRRLLDFEQLGNPWNTHWESECRMLLIIFFVVVMKFLLDWLVFILASHLVGHLVLLQSGAWGQRYYSLCQCVLSFAWALFSVFTIVPTFLLYVFCILGLFVSSFKGFASLVVYLVVFKSQPLTEGAPRRMRGTRENLTRHCVEVLTKVRTALTRWETASRLAEGRLREASRANPTCVQCRKRRADALHLPCGHCLFCWPCHLQAQQDTDSAKGCPWCGPPGTGAMRLGLRPAPHLPTPAALSLCLNRTLCALADFLAAPVPPPDEPPLWVEGGDRLLALARQAGAGWLKVGALKVSEDKGAGGLCLRCGCTRAATATLPCGHTSFCARCAEDSEDRGVSCLQCSSPGSVVPLLFRQQCAVCLEDVEAEQLLSMGTCAHLLCLPCTIRFVRACLGAAASEVSPQGLRCPHHSSGCTHHLHPTRLALIQDLPPTRPGPHLQDPDPDLLPLSSLEIRKLWRYMAEAEIPAERRMWCVNECCAAMLNVDLTVQLACEAPRVTCPHCKTVMCPRCKIQAHAAITCQEVQAMSSPGASSSSGTKSARLISATSKACPCCGLLISHYHGHACHHIQPGRGCPNCRTHFCYACSKVYVRARPQCTCSLFCSSNFLQINIIQTPYPHDKRCGCFICPDCRPGRRCHQCDGSCVVCKGKVPPGEMTLSVEDSSMETKAKIKKSWMSWMSWSSWMNRTT